MQREVMDPIKPTNPIPPLRPVPGKRRKGPLDREQWDDRKPARPPFVPVDDESDDDDEGQIVDEYV